MYYSLIWVMFFLLNLNILYSVSVLRNSPLAGFTCRLRNLTYIRPKWPTFKTKLPKKLPITRQRMFKQGIGRTLSPRAPLWRVRLTKEPLICIFRRIGQYCDVTGSAQRQDKMAPRRQKYPGCASSKVVASQVRHIWPYTRIK